MQAQVAPIRGSGFGLASALRVSGPGHRGTGTP